MAKIEAIDPTDGKDAVAKWQAAAAAAPPITPSDTSDDPLAQPAAPATPSVPHVTTLEEAKKLADQLGWQPNYFETITRSTSARAKPTGDPWVRS